MISLLKSKIIQSFKTFHVLHLFLDANFINLYYIQI